MKKLLVILLTLVMVFSFAACGEKTEPAAYEATANSIDLGGGLGEYSLEGTACGQYEVIDTPEEWVYDGYEVITYADLDCDVPYITVYRWDKAGMTLDEVAQEFADEYSEGYYQNMTDPNLNQESKYFFGHFEFEGDFYYWDSFILEDGDDFVEIDFCSKTNEIAIGDTGVYAWVPSGYTDGNEQEYIDYGTLFVGDYAEEYDLSEIWLLGPVEGYTDYEYDLWYWSDLYPDGLPISEEEYNKIIEKGITEESINEYYDAFGVEVMYASLFNNTEYPYNGSVIALNKDGKNYGTEIRFEVNGEIYFVWVKFDEDIAPAIGDSFLASLHTK